MNKTKIENDKRVINNDAILHFTDEMYYVYQSQSLKDVPFISRFYNLIADVILELKVFKKAQNSLPNKQVWEEPSGMTIELEWSDPVLRIHFKKNGMFKESIWSIRFSTADIQKLCLGCVATIETYNTSGNLQEFSYQNPLRYQKGLKDLLELILTQVRFLWKQK